MTVKQWQRRPSTFARQALGVYAALVVYGSLYPFSGWRSLGLGPFAYLTDPLPQYLTAFDVVTNVLGYMPFGALVVLALYPRWRSGIAVGAAFLGGALLSGSMEAIQTYLPTRVASNLDLAANALGALLGAVLTAPATSMLLDRGLLRRIRFTWFERDAAYVLGLSALWPFATMFPAPFLFALGDLPRVLWDGLDPSMQDAILAWVPAAWDIGSWLDDFGNLLPDDAWEALITSCNLYAALVLATLRMRQRAPRMRLMLGLLAATLGAKAGASFLQSRAGLTFDWATDGALEGIAIGAAGRDAHACSAARAARGARGRDARRRARAGERAAGESVLRHRARRLAARALSPLQRTVALARVDLAVCGARLARVGRGARVARAAPRRRFPPVAIIDRHTFLPMLMDSFYKYHVFFCLNQREPDAPRPSCANCNAQAMQEHAKKRVKKLGLAGEGKVRINKAGCLDRCELGPTLVVYPEGTWYTYVDETDIDEIVDSHLANGKIVERLLIDQPA